ncbi:MAG: CBS domain-containing protein [Polyangiaceae bacterium]|nr:CBS domain-containing protein [Polyangiaceae bacterium]
MTVDIRDSMPFDDPLDVPVARLMATNIVTLTRDMPVEEAARKMVGNHVSGMPVLDASSAIVGVVSLTDLVRVLTGAPSAEDDASADFYDPIRVDRLVESLLDDREHSGRTVGDVMSTRLVTVDPQDPLREAARAMARHRIHRVLVVDATGKLYGIVTALDVVSAVSA